MKKRSWGIITIVLLTIIPIVLWLMAEPVVNRFYNITGILTSIGQLTGLIGMSLFAINLILSARVRWIQPYFAGLNKIYSWHHKLGTYAFILLMVHPAVLAIKFFTFSVSSGWNFVTPSFDNWPKTYGMLGLILLFIFLALTYWVKIKYENWRWTHKFLGVAFVFGLVHALMVPSDISRYLPLKIYILTLSFVSLLAYVCHSWLARWLTPRFKYEVVGLRFYPPNIWEISMKAVGKPMKYLAGQFLFVEFSGEKIKKEVHPFSISSAANNINLKIAVKNLGDFTSTIDNLKPGDLATIEGPYGVFNYQMADHKEQIWIGGGIGLTPFLSMARGLEENCEYKIDLIYAVDYDKEAVFLSELKSISQKNPNFRALPHYSKKDGYLSALSLLDLGIGLKSKSIFICGPPLMMKALKKQFIERGVRPKDIYTEEFELI